MKILVLSDNHGLTNELKMIIQHHKVDEMIHCGDSEFKSDHPLLEYFIKVKGNCDLDSSFPNEEIIQLGNLTLLVTHGHLFGVKTDLLALSYRAQEAGAQMICYGHSHIAHADLIDQRLYINPGSIRQSKSELPESYVMLTIEEGHESVKALVEFYSMDHQVIKADTFQLPL